jgi:hypothetical protein
MEAIGVADQAVKRNALAGLADRVFDNINQAVSTILS